MLLQDKELTKTILNILHTSKMHCTDIYVCLLHDQSCVFIKYLLVKTNKTKTKERGKSNFWTVQNFIEHKLKKGKKIFNRFRNSLYNYVQARIHCEPIKVTKLCVSNWVIDHKTQNIHPQHSAFNLNSSTPSTSCSCLWLHTGEKWAENMVATCSYKKNCRHNDMPGFNSTDVICFNTIRI